MNCAKSKLYHWVLENFSDSSASAPQMSSNANNTYASGNNLPYAGADFTGGQNTPVKNHIAGEELKHKYNGISKFSELKEKANIAIKDIKTAAEDCLKKDCTTESFVALLDLLQKPEVLSVLEHMRQEIKLREQDAGKYK